MDAKNYASKCRYAFFALGFPRASMKHYILEFLNFDTCLSFCLTLLEFLYLRELFC
jgi:hypothetical protein